MGAQQPPRSRGSVRNQAEGWNMPRRDPCFVSDERLVSSNRQRVRRKDKERTEGNVWSGREAGGRREQQKVP